MKKIITTLSLLLVTLVSTSAFMYKYSSGIAGYTGAPGETSCANPGCHSGGTSTSSAITITATPSFTNGEYVPGTTYTISVVANAAGFTHYGFGCEILDDFSTSVGTMQTISGAGVKLLNAGSRRNAVHSTPKTANSGTATFNFKWVAPDEGGGNITIYAAANAVNLNGVMSGDFPIAPVNLVVAEGAAPVNTAIRSNEKTTRYDVSVYPSPANGFTTLSYFLNASQTIAVELIDISGKTVKELVNEKQDTGDHEHLLNLESVPAGVYFIKLSADNQKVAQKLITVQ